MKKPQPPQTTVTIDVAGKVLGRVASHVASILRGKHLPSFRPDVISGEKVIVLHAQQVHVTGTKLTSKMYAHFSGYPGGLTQEQYRDKLKRDPVGVFRLAVRRMLPDNKTRKLLLKRLTIKP